ncbi:hypothetical protein GN156_14505 [bacterium LRH843]|nr:hypothetical protein [bacterium LRH843]
MKKSIIIILSIIVVIIGGFYLYIKMNPPLVADSFAASSDRHVQLVSVGNKSWIGNITLSDVLVNNNEIPDIVSIQVSSPAKGFIISDGSESEVVSEYTFKDLKSVTLQTKTDPEERLVRMDNGTATEDDIYALSIGHESGMEKVIITYRHLGLSHKKTIEIPQGLR